MSNNRNKNKPDHSNVPSVNNSIGYDMTTGTVFTKMFESGPLSGYYHNGKITTTMKIDDMGNSVILNRDTNKKY